MTAAPTKPSRGSLPPGANLCEHCTAKCCQYIALPIATPKTWKDFDDIRWYVAHEDISVFVESRSWYLMVNRRCRYLQDDNRCGIYGTRPEVCRTYTTADCEYEDDYTYEKIFEHPDQVWEYAESVLGDGFVPARSLPILEAVR